ncbi:MAG: hypothetical protein PHX53_16535 [Syntrophales bacterium]|nr:hypothetical protein [Syntrophales bacterium]
MDWLKVEYGEEGKIKVPSNWLFLHYYEALSILFRVENALRVLVYIVLKNKSGLDWADTSISSDDGSKTTISALAKKRISQIQDYGYLGYQIGAPLMHLTSGELVRILISDSYWKLFKKYFNASKQVVTLKLEEIGTIRNSLAHFRPLTQNDVEVVKQNANQVFSVIEETLINIVDTGQRVPTNITDEWYVHLRSLGSQYCQFIHNQSPDGEWIRLSIQFNCPIMHKYTTDNYASYTVLSLNPVGMLKEYQQIMKLVTCIIEDVPYIQMPADFIPSITKYIGFIFLRDKLEAHYGELKTEFEKLLAEIDTEADLIKEDKFAQGKVVYISTLTARKKGEAKHQYWVFDYEKLLRSLDEKDPAEFWGSFSMYTRGLVSDANRFPWMPVPVSNTRFPW